MTIPNVRIAISLLLTSLTVCAGLAMAADDGVAERAVPSPPLSSMLIRLNQQLTQLERDARAIEASLRQSGRNAPAIVAARFPALSALAQNIAKEARTASEMARMEKQLQIQEKANRIAGDSAVISRQLDEARARADQATEAASTQLVAGIINGAITMKGAIGAAGVSAGGVVGGLVPGGAVVSTEVSGAAPGAAAGTGAAAGGAAPAGAGAPSGGAAAGVSTGAGSLPGTAASAGGGAAAGAAAGAAGAAQGGAAGAGAAAGAFPGAAGAGARSGAAPASLEQKVAFLEQQVQALTAQVAALQSVLKVTPTGAVLQAPTLSLLSIEATTIRSSKAVAIEAGTSMDMRSSANASIRAASTALIEGSGTLDLKGAVIKHNGGTKPLATVGSQVQVPPGQPIGQVMTGSQTVLGN